MKALLVKRYFTSNTCCQVSQELNARNTLTVSIELIPRVDGKNDYSRKVISQCKDNEVPMFLELLLMYRETYETRYHGSNKDKMMHLKNQTDGIFLFMREEKENLQHTFVIQDEFRYELVILFADVLAKRDGIGIDDVFNTIRLLATRRAQLGVNQTNTAT